LFKDLKDEDLEKESNSTGICNRQLFKVAITQQGAKCQSKWSEVGINEEISRLQSVLEEKSKTDETESGKKSSEEKNRSGKNSEEKNKSGKIQKKKINQITVLHFHKQK